MPEPLLIIWYFQVEEEVDGDNQVLWKTLGVKEGLEYSLSTIAPEKNFVDLPRRSFCSDQSHASSGV